MRGAADTFVLHCTLNTPPHRPIIKKRYIWVETKTPTGVQSKAQKRFQAHIEQMGEEYHIVRSKEEFIYMINHPPHPHK